MNLQEQIEELLNEDFDTISYNEIYSSKDYKDKIEKAKKIYNYIKTIDSTASFKESINRNGGISCYIKCTIKQNYITIRISDHDTNYSTARLEVSFNVDINKIKKFVDNILNEEEIERQKKLADDKAEEKYKKEIAKYIKTIIKQEHIDSYQTKGLKGLEMDIRNRNVKDIKTKIKTKYKQISGKDNVGWSQVMKYIDYYFKSIK